MTDSFDVDRAYARAFQVVRDYYDERTDPEVREVARAICAAHLEDPDEIVCDTILQPYDAVGRQIAPRWCDLRPRWRRRLREAEIAIKIVRTPEEEN